MILDEEREERAALEMLIKYGPSVKSLVLARLAGARWTDIWEEHVLLYGNPEAAVPRGLIVIEEATE